MRRRLTLAATWVAATVLATFVVSLGVRVVTSEVTTRRPAPLALVRAAVTTTTTTTSTTSTTSTTVLPPPTTVAPRPATATTVRRPAPTTTTTTVPAIVRTANGQGGSITVRFAPGAASLVVATPAPGYAVQVLDDGPRVVSVRFRSDRHETRVFARAGDARIVVDEDDDHHGGGGGGGHGAGPGRR